MKKKFVRDISASSLPHTPNLLTGARISYTTSRYPDKNGFDELNCSVAIPYKNFRIN